MTPEQFAYWLQGFAELHGCQEHPSKEQWASIKDHLSTVFNKVTWPIQYQQFPYRTDLPGKTEIIC